jgi:hypothetical protein
LLFECREFRGNNERDRDVSKIFRESAAEALHVGGKLTLIGNVVEFWHLANLLVPLHVAILARLVETSVEGHIPGVDPRGLLPTHRLIRQYLTVKLNPSVADAEGGLALLVADKPVRGEAAYFVLVDFLLLGA